MIQMWYLDKLFLYIFVMQSDGIVCVCVCMCVVKVFVGYTSLPWFKIDIMFLHTLFCCHTIRLLLKPLLCDFLLNLSICYVD
jgi:hypothetical protein